MTATLCPLFVVLSVGLAPSAALATSRERRDEVALLISRSAYAQLRREVGQYRRDVEALFAVRLRIVTGEWVCPEQVRDVIAGLCRRNGTGGVVLVGAVPMHRFRMHDFDNPNALYYEAPALEFVSTSGGAVPDKYSGPPQLKLWVANLRAVESDNDDGIEVLRTFLNKTHAYYTGRQTIERRALAITGSDWPDGASVFAREVGAPLFGAGNTDVLSCKDASPEAIRDAFAKHNYTMLYIQVHSTCTRQDMDTGGTIHSREIEGLATGALFTVNHGCSTCNWSKAAAEKGRNTCMAWVFGKGVGQAAVGNVRTGMVYGQQALYERLLAGDYLGRAYFAAKRSAEEEMHREYPKGDVVSGLTLVGNPFLTIRRETDRDR